MSLFGAFVPYWFVFQIVLGVPVVFDEGDGDGYPDYNTFQTLESLGDKIFGEPRPSSGASVSQWTPSSDVFPEELGEYHEGDILHPYPSSRNGLRAKSSRWPDKTIPYEISPFMRRGDRQMIQEAIDEFHKHTCIKFKERSGSDSDYVYFTNSNTGCWSSVGRIGGRQEINLQTPGCTSQRGTVIHEMLHAVGFMHEQNRPDRDKYVIINYQNIESGKESNFEKAQSETVDNQGVGYDYHSVMHYSGNAFSRNGRPTIEPKARETSLGQREGFTKKDLQKISKMYRCNRGGDSLGSFISSISAILEKRRLSKAYTLW